MTRQRPHPILDRIVVGLLVLVWLLAASGATYAGNLLAIVILWGACGWGCLWLYGQYREHTRPHALSPPAAPGTRLPLLARLYLLPGMHHLIGPVAVKRARNLRSLRRDQARHPELAATVRQRLAEDRWDDPGAPLESMEPRIRCQGDGHWFEPRTGWCDCRLHPRKHYEQPPYRADWRVITNRTDQP